METLRNDVRYALRVLRRSPLFALVATLTLALGIAASTSVFSVINSLLLRPLPVSEPDRLVSLSEKAEGFTRMNMGQSVVSYPRYVAYRDATGKAFADLAGHDYVPISLRLGGDAEPRLAVVATSNYFTTLGLRPEIGRLFSPGTADEPGVVVSDALWRSRLGADPGAVGRILWINGRQFPILGVAPAGFGGTMAVAQADVWISAETARATGVLAGAAADDHASGPWLVAFGRLRPGVSPAQASAVVNAAGHAIPMDEGLAKLRQARVEPFSALPGVLRQRAWLFMALLLGTGLLVLMISSANVAGMLLARAAARRRELAIRMAVGGGRGRLVQQMVTESTVLFVLGGGAGVLLSLWALRLLERLPSPVPGVRIALHFPLDLRVLAFALAVALATGLTFGLAPALQATRGHLALTLRGGAGQPGRGSRSRSAVVVAQLAMSSLLLLTAGLFARALQSALHSDPGFDPKGVVVTTLDLAPHGYDEARGRVFYRTLEERVRALPGVESVGLSRFAPLSGSRWTTEIAVPGRTETGRGVSVDAALVDGDLLRTLRIPVRAGRDFEASDRDGGAPVALVNETMARRFWPDRDPLGQTVEVDGRRVQVVGVTADAHLVAEVQEAVPVLYLPFAQNYSAEMVLHVRARGDAGTVIAGLRRELRAMNPDIAPMQSQTLVEMIRTTLLPQRIGALAIGAFGAVGLLLAAIGIYGVLAYRVSMRTREIGIRMALGARLGSVVAIVVGSSLRLSAVGTGIGLLVALGVGRLLSGMLYGVSPSDPLTYGAVAALLLGAALLASWLPARRAARVDPMVALRTE